MVCTHTTAVGGHMFFGSIMGSDYSSPSCSHQLQRTRQALPFRGIVHLIVLLGVSIIFGGLVRVPRARQTRRFFVSCVWKVSPVFRHTFILFWFLDRSADRSRWLLLFDPVVPLPLSAGPTRPNEEGSQEGDGRAYGTAA